MTALIGSLEMLQQITSSNPLAAIPLETLHNSFLTVKLPPNPEITFYYQLCTNKNLQLPLYWIYSLLTYTHNKETVLCGIYLWHYTLPAPLQNETWVASSELRSSKHHCCCCWEAIFEYLFAHSGTIPPSEVDTSFEIRRKQGTKLPGIPILAELDAGCADKQK